MRYLTKEVTCMKSMWICAQLESQTSLDKRVEDALTRHISKVKDL